MTGNWYQITGQTTGVSLTLDRSTGLVAGTGITINIGGCLATPGLAAILLTVSGMLAWTKYSSTAFSLTTATLGSGGPISLPTGIACSFEGYDQTRGDRTGNRPQVSWASVAAPGGLTYIFSAAGANRQRFANLSANGNSVNNVGGFNVSNSRASSIQCVALNCNGTAGIGIAGTITVGCGSKSCQANTCTTGFLNGVLASCWATGCTTGFSNPGAGVNLLATLNTNGIVSSTNGLFLDRCTCDSNTTSGFVITGISELSNCLASNHTGGSGIGFNCGALITTLDNCSAYNNTTNISGTPVSDEGLITLTAQPYVTAGSQFAPNTTAGGGALLRGAGIGVFGQTDNCDVGAVQHADPSGGGMLVNPGMTGGIRG